MNMKKFVLLTVVLAFLTGCGSKDRGQLVGVKGKKWHPEKPFGMTLVPGGAFIMGKADDDLAGIQDAPAKTVTVRAFYILRICFLRIRTFNWRTTIKGHFEIEFYFS